MKKYITKLNGVCQWLELEGPDKETFGVFRWIMIIVCSWVLGFILFKLIW